MATVSVTVPDTLVTRVGDAFVAQYPPPEGTDVTNAATRIDYVKSLLIAYMKQVVAAHEAAAAAETARTGAATKADTEITLT